MVALVRAGVTATCSSADKPRYGDLAVDSNLPDARIALGGPDQNTFTAAVLADADPAYTEELKRQLYASGTAGCGCRPAAPLAASWLPGADLRGVRALPVLIVAGADSSTPRSRRWSTTSPTPRSSSTRRRRRTSSAFEDRTVAVLNRGVPGFAVDTDGTLHTSLMRSCTGWPSGVWIDPPRRTAPDGSNFQLQHWTHTFDYALVSGDGDWRRPPIPARSAEFSHPLLAVAGNSSAAGGLPSWGSLSGDRARGRGAARRAQGGGQSAGLGSAGPSTPPTPSRCGSSKHCGATTDVAITSGLRRVSAASRVDLLEQPRLQEYDVRRTDLHGYEIATVLTPAEHAAGARRRPRSARTRGRGGAAAVCAVLAAQPRPRAAGRPARRRAPAPAGHLSPSRMTKCVLRLTVASDCTRPVLHGTVRLVCPAGWTASPASLPFVLPRGEHLEADVELTMPPDAPPGLYPVRAQLAVTGDDAVSMPRIVAAGRRGRRDGVGRHTAEDNEIVRSGRRARRCRGGRRRDLAGSR